MTSSTLTRATADHGATAGCWAPPDPAARRRAPRTRRANILIVLATATALGSIAIGNGAVGAIAFLFVVSWPLERLWRRHPVPVRRLALRTDLAYAAAQPALQFAGLVVAIVVGVLSLAWLPGLLLRPFVTGLPPLAQMLGGFLVFDFLIYWTHRWGHTVPLFWRFHAVHHSTRHLDWVSGFRAHPFDGVFIAPVVAFFLAAGVDNRITGGLAIVQFLVGLGAHLNVRFRLRPLWPVVMTPEFHHWHHELSHDAHHSNYSTFLPLWDILFGTYRMPRNQRPQHYGIPGPMPDGIARQLVFPLRGLRGQWREWRRARRVARAARRSHPHGTAAA
ncbi:MAG: sterol desaturase family protein [Actinomycetota bacterium]|nr:sterol desaturase family protein [Actinomycetota bacterium]